MFSKVANSVDEYCKHVDAFWLKDRPTVADWIWYRGVASYPEFRLVPSFFRNFVPKPKKAIVDDYEKILVREFLYKYDLYDTSHIGRLDADSPEVVFGKMQHYGFSTRLQDFSYSAMVALWMAVGDWQQWRNGAEIAHPDKDGAVWLLNPCIANQQLGHKRAVLRLALNQNYLPLELRPKGQKLPVHPVAVEAPLSNRRIVAQQGCFVCFGLDPTPLDDQLGRHFEDIGLIRIPANRKARIYDQLERLGITEDMLFQDLPSYAIKLHRHYAQPVRDTST